MFGAFHPGPDDSTPPGTGTLVLIGPREPGFWPHFTASPEYRDALPDPLDRWSKRVIGAVAQDWAGRALFPSDGPPWPPFIAWALRSGRTWQSPVGLLVHDRAGLFVSYRGALALPGRLDLPATPPRPCDSCADQPCRTACPVDALGETYDIPACHAFLDQPQGRACLETGCAARRACPISQSYGRMAEQSAFHMASFHP